VPPDNLDLFIKYAILESTPRVARGDRVANKKGNKYFFSFPVSKRIEARPGRPLQRLCLVCLRFGNPAVLGFLIMLPL